MKSLRGFLPFGTTKAPLLKEGRTGVLGRWKRKVIYIYTFGPGTDKLQKGSGLSQALQRPAPCAAEMEFPEWCRATQDWWPPVDLSGIGPMPPCGCGWITQDSVTLRLACSPLPVRCGRAEKRRQYTLMQCVPQLKGGRWEQRDLPFQALDRHLPALRVDPSQRLTLHPRQASAQWKWELNWDPGGNAR
jgi:hypothetical protein